jgi:hypothetical protein
MSISSSLRPLSLVLAAAALVLAGAVGALLATGGSPASLTAAPADAGSARPAAPVAVAAVPAPDSGSAARTATGGGATSLLGAPTTIDAAVAAALGDPSSAFTAGAARRAGILRLLIGKTDRAEITVSTSTGERTLLYVRGTIGAISASSVSVTLPDGSSQAFSIDATTRIRSKGRAVATTALSEGDRILVLGLKSGTSYSALVVRSPGVPPAKRPAGGAPGSAPGSVPTPTVPTPTTGG